MSRLDPRPLVLIADDQPAMARSLGELLTSWGYQVETVASGPAAIAAAARMIPDLILMDIHMPGTDGLQAARAIRQIRTLRDVPILFLGSHPHAEASFPKPACPTVLRQKLAHLLAPKVALPA
ncbi:N/A [soil metagenome]